VASAGEAAVDVVEIGQHVVLRIVGLDQMGSRLELKYIDTDACDWLDIPLPSQSDGVTTVPDIQRCEGGGVLDSSLLLDEFGSGMHGHCAYLLEAAVSGQRQGDVALREVKESSLESYIEKQDNCLLLHSSAEQQRES
jgi:hypothetical protein